MRGRRGSASLQAMTTPPLVEPATAPPPPEPGANRIERPAGHPFRGVARAVARATGTDPTLWRVLLVVLTVFNGLGLALYVGGLVAIPQEGQQRSLADRLLNGPHRRLAGADIALLVAAGLLAVVLLGSGNTLLAVVVLGVVAALALRHPAEGGYVVPPAAPPGTAVAAEPAVPTVARARRRRSILGRLTASVALLVVSLELLAAALGNDAIDQGVVIASALVVVGLGLVAGAWWGRSTGLVVLAVLLALGLFASTAVDGVVGKGVGERRWQPTSAGSYELGIGEGVLDLRRPELASAQGTIEARVGVGHLVVLVPGQAQRELPRLFSRFPTSCGMGRSVFRSSGAEIEVDGLTIRGLGRRQESSGVNRQLTVRSAALPGLTVDLEVGIGAIEVCDV